MVAHSFAVTHSSAVPNWRTENALYDALDAEFGIHFDAAASRDNCKKGAAHYFGPDQDYEPWRDALAIPSWRETVSFEERIFFCNPPSSREQKMPLGPWFKKFEEQALEHGATIVAVVPNKPSERYWKHTRSAVEIRTIPHRVRYWLPPEELAVINDARRLIAAEAGKEYRPISSENTAGFPTAVVIWRPQPGIIQPATPRHVTWSYRPAKP